MTDEALSLEDARVAFGGVRGLDGMSLALRPGEMLGLVGPDGAGKTTALRALLGLVPLDAGRATLLGRDPRAADPAERGAVGYLSQRFTLYGDLTVDENLAFFAELFRVRAFRDARERLLGVTRLGPFRRLRADRLSGGMQKKLALACTLVHAPRLLLLDEPTTGVDPVSRREFWQLLSGLLAEGLSVLLTTPYLDEAERCGRVALVRAGRVLACDAPAALRAGLRVRIREVVGAPARAARDLLAREPRVAEVHLFGDRLHVVPRDPADGLDDLLARLPGVTAGAPRDVAPTLEDVFIRRIGEAEAA